MNPDRLNPGVVNLSGFSEAVPGATGDIYNGWMSPYGWVLRTITVEAAVRDVVAAGNVVVTSANNYSTTCENYTPSILGYNGNGITAQDLDSSGNAVDVYIHPSVITVGATALTSVQNGVLQNLNGKDVRWQTATTSGAAWR